MAAKPRKSVKSSKSAAPAPDVAAIAPEVIAPVETSSDAPQAPKMPKVDSFKMKELLTAVAQKTSAKKKDVKEIVDAALVEIAAALLRGQPLSLPPLGNLRVAKTQEKDGAMLLALKLRIGPDGGSNGAKNRAKQALAADGEDS